MTFVLLSVTFAGQTQYGALLKRQSDILLSTDSLLASAGKGHLFASIAILPPALSAAEKFNAPFTFNNEWFGRYRNVHLVKNEQVPHVL